MKNKTSISGNIKLKNQKYKRLINSGLDVKTLLKCIVELQKKKKDKGKSYETR
jgi:uncharacterized protein (UPF0335 family)